MRKQKQNMTDNNTITFTQNMFIKHSGNFTGRLLLHATLYISVTEFLSFQEYRKRLIKMSSFKALNKLINYSQAYSCPTPD